MFYTCLSVHGRGDLPTGGLPLVGLHSGGGGLLTWWSVYMVVCVWGICIWGRGLQSAFWGGGLHPGGMESATRRRGSASRGPGEGFCIQGVGGSASRGEGSASGGETPGTRNVGGLHPTGMLSCLSYFVRIKRRNGKFSRSIFHDHNVY